MTIKLFWSNSCPKCPAAKSMVAGMSDVELHNVEEVDGLAEAAFYSVMATPSIVVCDESGGEVSSWRGEIPPLQDLEKCLRR